MVVFSISACSGALVRVVQGSYRGYLAIILVLFKVKQGLCRDSGKENGNYYLGLWVRSLVWGFIGPF